MDNNMVNDVMEMLKQMKTEMNQRLDKIEQRLDKVEERLESVENKHYGIEQQFKETEKAIQSKARTQLETENAVQRTLDFHKITFMDMKQEILSLKMEQVSNKEMHDSVRYLTHKSQELEKQLHTLRKQQ